MKKKSLIFVLCGLCVCSFAENVVARCDFDVPASWKYPQIQGRDFWFMLPQTLSNNQDFSRLPKYYHSPSLQKVPVFQDAGLAVRDYKPYNKIPENFVMKDLFYSKANPWWNQLEAHPKKNVPLMVSLGACRPSFLLREHYKHDQANYQAFIKRHPNLYMFNSLGEWDNELVNYDRYFLKSLTAEQKKKMLQTSDSLHNFSSDFLTTMLYARGK